MSPRASRTEGLTTPEMVAKLEDYPNLQAMMQGCVSGHYTEWPLMRVELRRLMDTYERSERAQGNEDAERYRWFKDCGSERQAEIVEAAEGKRHMLDHHIDKGRAGL